MLDEEDAAVELFAEAADDGRKVVALASFSPAAAQRLYDKVAKRMDHLRYDLHVCDP